MKKILLSLLVLLPLTTFAQGLQEYIPNVLEFINEAILPFLLGIAFLILVINVIRYFVAGSTSEEGREKAKAYILYSIIAFVLIIVFFGVINLLVNATGLQESNAPTPDIPGYPSGGGTGGGGSDPYENWSPTGGAST